MLQLINVANMLQIDKNSNTIIRLYRLSAQLETKPQEESKVFHLVLILYQVTRYKRYVSV